MNVTPLQLSSVLSSCVLVLSELDEAIYLSALRLSSEEARFLGCVAFCLDRIGTGEPLPAEAVALPLGAWLTQELETVTREGGAPRELGLRLRRALEAAHRR